MSAKSTVAIVAACVLAAAGGYVAYTRLQKPAADTVSFPEPGKLVTRPGEAWVKLPEGLKLTGTDGQEHALDDYRGKLVVLNFWATWCGPCLHEIPALIKVQTAYGARGVQLLGPAVDDPDEVKAQAAKLGFNYPVFVGESDAMLDLMTQLGNSAGALPFSVVIGPDGQIISRQLGEFAPVELEGLLDEQLAKKS